MMLYKNITKMECKFDELIIQSIKADKRSEYSDLFAFK